MSTERADSSDPDIAWIDARADEVVALVKDTLRLKPSMAVSVLATAIGFVIARSDNEWTEDGMTRAVDMARQSFLADRAGDIGSSPNARSGHR